MKKFTLLFITLFFATITFGQNIEKASQEAAEDICACTDAMIGDAHPQMIAYIYNVDAYGQAQAMEIFQEYLTTASEADKEKIMEDATRFQNVMSSPEYTECLEKISTKYADFDYNSDFQELVQAKLESTEGCALTVILIKMGQGGYE